MKTYAVTIEETLSKTVKVRAENVDEAVRKVCEDYRKGDIVLMADDYVDTWIGSTKDYGYRFDKEKW